MGNVNILIGCGGSGLKTLLRVNQMLSQDPSWRERMWNEIYYFGVDTSLDDLTRFQNQIRQDFTRYENEPAIRTLHLTEGKTMLQPFVNERFLRPFANGDNPEGKQRLLEHWWNRGPEFPYNASAVKGDLRVGAGQCPPISFFLAWYEIERLEQQILQLKHEMSHRTDGYQGIGRVNMIVVGSLAGGTGRGCWNLIAYKFRCMFAQFPQNLIPSPRAFLFDSSVFPDVMQEFPKQKLSLQVNSLTGLSELSCWVANQQQAVGGAQAIKYSLPSWSAPENPDSDFLQIDFGQNDNNAAPVNHVHLIFGENVNHALGRSDNYFEMAGAAIFGLLAESRMNNTEINSNNAYNSLGASTFEINAATIRRYFESRIREQCAKSLLQEHDDATLKEFNAFVQETNLIPDKLFEILTTAIQNHADISQNRDSILNVAAREQDAQLVVDGIIRTLQPPNADEIAEQTVKSAAPINRAALLAAARSHAENLFNETQSIATVHSFYNRIETELRNRLVDAVFQLASEPADAVKVATSLSTRRNFFFKIFEPGEIDLIKEAVNVDLICHFSKPLAKYLQKALDGIADQIKFTQQQLSFLMLAVGKAKDKYTRQLLDLLPGKTMGTSRDVFEQLFANPLRPENSIPPRISSQKFFRRTIKPMMSQEDEAVYIKDETSPGNDVQLLVREVIQSQFRDVLENVRDTVAVLTPRVESAFAASVGLSSKFISNHFTLQRVVAGNIDAWSNRINSEKSEDERNRLLSQFQNFFGFRPRQQGDAFAFPSTDQVLCHMAISLGKITRPYWILDGDSDCTVRVFFQTQKMKEDEVKAYINEQVGPAPGFSAKVEQVDINPFMMLGFATGGVNSLDEIQSTKYYRNASLVNFIKDCEDPSGPTIYDTRDARNGGLGFIDPSYVKNESMRNLRWRPWADAATDQAVADSQQAISCLFYLLFGNHLVATDPTREAIEGVGLAMPLLRAEKGNQYKVSRQPRKWDVTTKSMVESNTRFDGWEVDKPLATHAGIVRLHEALQAKPVIREIVETEAQAFWSHVLTQVNCPPGTPNFKKLLEGYATWLSSEYDDEKSNEGNKAIWKLLMEHIESLLG